MMNNFTKVHSITFAYTDIEKLALRVAIRTVEFMKNPPLFDNKSLMKQS